MAAGRFDVSKRRDYHGGSGKDQGGDHIRGRGNSYRSSSSVRKFEFRRSGFSCANEERKMDHSFSLERSRRFEDVDEVQIRLEKKRKFSHDICDELEDKNLSGSSWNRVDLASTNSSPVPSSDVGATKYPFMGSRVVELGSVTDKDCVEKLKSPTVLSSLLPLERDGDHDEQQDDHGENVFPETRNLSMSRWASEDDSPGNTSISDEEDMQGKVVHKMSSPESGEVISEASGGILTRSSGFNRCGSRDENSNNELENDEIMDYEKLQGSNVSVIQMDSDDKFSQIDESTASTERSINMLQGCRSVFEFERLDEINEGTYGKVYKARDRTSGELVALKKVKMNVGGSRNLEEYGFPLSALREINILLSFQHPSIVNVKEVVMDDLNGVFMVMEYMEHDLKGFMQSMKRPFSTSEVKCLMLQLLEGVKYLHDNWVIHRDLKTSNLLLNNQGELKICDFGMSRQYGSPLKPYTSLVVTLWYRAPELLLGAKQYSTAIDMWSVGCIMAELLAKEPLFKGKTEIDQLDKIFRVLGTPNGTEWPGLSKLPGAKANFVKQPYKDVLRNKFPAASFTGFSVLSDLGFDLLKKLLTFDPEKRITVDAALKHPWFREDPEPKSKECMPTFPPQYARNR